VLLQGNSITTMETSLYRIIFKDGREYRVFCANRRQNKDMLHIVYKIQDMCKKRGGVTIITNGIHNMKQWKDIIKLEK